MRIRSFFVMRFGAGAFVQAASSPIQEKLRMSLRIYRSYAESRVRRDRFAYSMRIAILLMSIMVLAGAAVSLHAEQKFTASDIPGLHLRKAGAVVITNE